MFDVSDFGPRLLVQQAWANQRLSAGLLMSPTQLADATAGGKAAAMLSGWFLCGHVHPSFFALCRASPVQHLAQTFVSEAGIVYVVLAQQINDWQHRLALQMIGDDMRDYLRYVQTSPMRFSLAEAGGAQTLLVQAPEHLREVMPADLHVQPVSLDLAATVGDTLRVVASLLDPGTVTDENLGPVRDVCVSVIQSQQLAQAWQQASHAGTGSGPH